MTALEERNRRFLADLFAGPFRQHGVVMTPEGYGADCDLGDFTLSGRPVRDWLPSVERRYALQARWMEAMRDDSVPFANLHTSTAVFAAAFGCRVHHYQDSPPAARPIVSTAEDADRLELPTLDAPPLRRFFELAELVRDRLGPEVPISAPDVQSPFDIAALIWNKEDLYIAMLRNPDAVMRLVGKCHQLLKTFLSELKRRFPECSLAHCPLVWAPPALGCWLSEDEAGAMSVPMFEEFCFPSLSDLSRTFGGLFIHCCATADHQYETFLKIPNLRGMNRVFQSPGPQPAVDAFSGRAVLMVAWTGAEECLRMLKMARPDTRFLFNLPEMPLDEAKRTLDALRSAR